MDSMNLKLESYRHSLAQFNFEETEVERLMRHHMGQSRQRILRSIYKELTGGENMPENLFEIALAKFNAHDDEARSRMEFVPGTLDFLKIVHERFFTAIITGTPENCILKTTAHFNLDCYFDIVRGSPDKKIDITKELLKKNNLNPKETIFIGDGKTDQDAADHHGIRFVGRGKEGTSFTPATAWRIVEDLHELLPDLE